MTACSDSKFVRLLWKDKLWSDASQLLTTDGATVTVLERGDADEASDNFVGAKLIVGGVMHSGDITFADSDVICDKRAILQVVVAPCSRLCKDDGELLPQLTLPIGIELIELYQDIVAHSRTYACGDYIASLDNCQLGRIITRLQLERMERKHNELKEIHHEGNNNWNYTLYVALFRAMGAPMNKEPFTQLALRVPYGAVSHEKGNPECVEAMLLGGSGLLQTREESDKYIRRQRLNFEHLQAKYDIKPLHHSEWKLRGNTPNGFVLLRLAQLAAFLSTAEFVFDNLIACRSAKDIQSLFAAEASQYWSNLLGSVRSKSDLKRIGDDRKNVLGINLVAPLMFAYGEVMRDEELKETAMDLLEKIPAENNSIVKGWRSGGVVIKSALDSQAMIQLTNEYCLKRRCSECPFGKAQIKEKFNKDLK